MRPPVQRLIQLFDPNLKFMCRLPVERMQNGIFSNCLPFMPAVLTQFENSSSLWAPLSYQEETVQYILSSGNVRRYCSIDPSQQS